MQIKKGDRFSGCVKDLTSDGRGVVEHPSGRIFFVVGVWFGEAGEFRVTGLKGRIGFAEVVALDDGTRHPERIAPACAHYGHCGGCPWQFVGYSAQLQAKQQRTVKNLRRLDPNINVRPILPSEQAWGYRNRAQFKTDGEQLGYVAAGSNRLIPVEQCPILNPVNQKTLQALLAKLPDPDWRPAAGRGWTTIDIDDNTEASSVSINARLPFRQGNTAQNQVMRQWLAAQLAQIAIGKNVLELFCGSGNLTEEIVESGAGQVVAVEVVETALEQLRSLALPGVKTVACNLFDAVDTEKLIPYVKTSEILVLDPPRDGLKVTEPLLIKKSAIRHICYISCDLATFVRDLQVFQRAGFRVQEVQPLDLFPQTPHVELMGVLHRA